MAPGDATIVVVAIVLVAAAVVLVVEDSLSAGDIGRADASTDVAPPRLQDPATTNMATRTAIVVIPSRRERPAVASSRAPTRRSELFSLQ